MCVKQALQTSLSAYIKNSNYTRANETMQLLNVVIQKIFYLWHMTPRTGHRVRCLEFAVNEFIRVFVCRRSERNIGVSAASVQ